MPATIIVNETVNRQTGDDAATKNYAKFAEMKKATVGRRMGFLLNNSGQPYIANELLAAAEKKLGKTVKSITITIEAHVEGA